MRGWAIALPTSMPCTVAFNTICRIAPRRRTDPALPTTRRGRPPSSTTDGAIMLVNRRPIAPLWLRRPTGLRSYSPSMLLRWMPVPGTITPAPEPFEAVSEAAAVEVAREAAAAGAGLLAHHLGQAGDRLGASRWAAGAEPREQLERIGDQDPARGGRRIRDELVAVEGAADRPPGDHAVLGEILLREAAALGANVVTDATAELAAVESGPALVGKQLEGGRELGHHEPVARDKAHAFGTKDLATGLGAPKDHVEDRVQEGLRLRQLVPLARDRDRGLQQAPPGQGRVGAVSRFEPGDRPGYADRGTTDAEDLRRPAVELDVDRFHLPGRAREALAGDRDEEVVQADSPRRRLADEQEAASARTGERALGDPGHAGSGNARVDRVPAFAQHLGARLGGERVPGRHRASHPGSVTAHQPGKHDSESA